MVLEYLSNQIQKKKKKLLKALVVVSSQLLWWVSECHCKPASFPVLRLLPPCAPLVSTGLCCQ